MLLYLLLCLQPISWEREPPRIPGYCELRMDLKSMREEKPLLVFVSCIYREVPGNHLSCRWDSAEALLKDSSPRIVVFRNGYWVTDLDPDATDDVIQEALKIRQPFVRMTVPRRSTGATVTKNC